MIRAIIKDGKLCPLDPLPEEWTEGTTLEIDGYLEPPDDLESIDRNFQELEASIAQTPYDPEDWKRLDEALAEADRIAKDQVRKEMGLS